ncbi:MAG TPA: FecR domain-containing protein [Bradyrhizobium sp.]|nr:FecR domain-containing protein [Bradyrhizobium sp.]
MNFVGKFDAKLPLDDADIHSGRHFQVDSSSVHAPADAIVVPDVHLLFGGDYKRSGVDLILSESDHELVLHDYFKGEKRAALAAPEGGAHLTGDIVSALAGGHVEYAQAGGAAAAAAVVGHVTKLVGSATAIRNGVSIVLAPGDNIQKGDVLQSGSDSTLGVTFIDGTVFGLSSNARMVVNELVYDPNGSNNSSLLSLVQGTISFVAGETAKHGDMKVDTPVATMGIRGTAVLVQIDFDTPGGTPDAKFQVLVEPDGHTGSYVLYDKTTLDPIATVNQAGHQVNISHGVVTYSTNGLSPELQKLITDVFALKFSDNTNPNTKSLDHFTDSIVPALFTPFKFVNVPNVTPIAFTVNNAGAPVQFNFGFLNLLQHIPIAPIVSAHGGAEAERIGVTGDAAPDTVSGKISFSDINLADRPTAAVVFDAVSYQTTQHQDVTSLLSKQQLIAIESAISISQDPGNTNQGSATWTYSISDRAFDFLGAGETLTLTYLVKVSNNYAPDIQVTTVPITITITGTNDVPVFTSSAPKTIAFNGNTNISGDDLVATGPTSGTMSFSDPDLTDSHKVSVALVGAALDGNAASLPSAVYDLLKAALSASIATDSTDTGNGTINWSLANLPASIEGFVPAGETLTLTYTLTVTDSQGATSAPQDITVTIGSGVVWVGTGGSSSGGLWSDPSNWSTGALPTANDDISIVTDPQHGLTPSFPVTINAPAAAGSVTMNDFGTSPPELINESTLTISGAFTMSADSIVENYGTITVGGLMAIGDHSVLDNFGTLTLKQGGDFSGHSTISNAATGTIEVSGGTLDVEVDIANSGLISVGASGTVAVETATISGGTVTNYGTFDLTGSAALKDGALHNYGQINVSGTGNVLTDETIDGGIVTIIVPPGFQLHEDVGTTLVDVNLFTPIVIEAASSLALDEATITGGKIVDNGTIEISGDSEIAGAIVSGTGQIVVDAGETLTLDSTSVSGNAIVNHGTINVDADAVLLLSGVSLVGGALTNGGFVEIDGSSSIDNDTVGNNHLVVDNGQTLTLSGTTITGGTLDNSGIVDIEGLAGATLDGVAVSGSGTIQIDAPDLPATTLVLQNGTTVTGGKLTIGPVGALGVKGVGGATLKGVSITNDNSIEIFAASLLALAAGTTVANKGTIIVDSKGTLSLDDASITGGTIADHGLVRVTGDSTINSAELTGGHVAVSAGQTLTLDNVTVSYAHVDDTAKSSIIQVDGGDALTLYHATISGGMIDDYSAVSSGMIDGYLDIAGSSRIRDAALNHGHVTIEAGQTLTLDDVVATGTTFDDTAKGATIKVDSGDKLTLNGVTIDSGTLAINGSLEIAGPSTIDSAVVNNASITVDSGETLTLRDVAAAGSTITLAGSNDTLNLDSAFRGTIAGWNSGDTINLTDLAYSASETAVWNSANHTLTISNGAQTEVLTLEGSYTQNDFALTQDSSGHTELMWNDVPATLAVLNGSGDAVAGSMLTAGLNDPHATGITFTWLADGKVVPGQESSGFTPTSADLGKAIDVVIGFTDHGVTEQLTETAGIVVAPPTLSETNPPVQTVILARSPIVLGQGVSTNSLGLRTETFDHVFAGSASNNGLGHGNFTDPDLGATFTASGDAGIVHGSSSVSAAPFMELSPGHAGADDTNYLSIGAGGSETVTFASEQNTFGLYWGSVDPFNTISFYDGTKLVATYTGAEIAPLLSDGGQGSFNSNGYVEFTDLAPFNKVVLASAENAFEVDNISAGYIADSHVHLENPVTGTLTVSGADVGDTLSASVVGEGVVDYDGSTALPQGADMAALTNPDTVTFDSVTSDGGSDVLHWTYNPGKANFDFLEPGDTLTLTFDAQVHEGAINVGDQQLTVTLVGAGASTVNGTSGDDTFVNVGGGVTIFGNGGHDTFVFNDHFGSATIADFNVNQDVIDLSHTLFASVSDILAHAHPADFGHDTVITDAARDQITLTGVTVAQLQAHATSDFHLV